MQQFALTAAFAYVFALVQAASADTKVKVDVYYETLCPDSISFMTRKLIPNYETISSMAQINLHPFGKAEIYEFKDTIDFYCQHGPKECRGNMIHNCVLNEYKQNFTKALDYIECSLFEFYGKSKPNVDQVSKDCAKEENVDWDKIESCISGAQGKQLLVEAGKKTKALRPKLSFVPTIVINEKYSDSNQNKALYGDFVKLICSNHVSPTKPNCTADN